MDRVRFGCPPDAVVIGAGPAGSVAARELARSGARVLLVDKTHFPRPKVCGCCVNGAAIRTLRKLGLGHVVASGVPLRNVLIGAGHRAARVSVPAGVALSREAFDTALVAEAERAGAEFRPGASARAVGDGSVLVGAERLSPRVTVIASGLTGGDTPQAGSRVGAGTAVPAGGVPAFFGPGTIFMATGPGGYVGLVRVEDGRSSAGSAGPPFPASRASRGAGRRRSHAAPPPSRGSGGSPSATRPGTSSRLRARGWRGR
jgi:flavin-dependent dehydrogenase